MRNYLCFIIMLSSYLYMQYAFDYIDDTYHKSGSNIHIQCELVALVEEFWRCDININLFNYMAYRGLAPCFLGSIMITGNIPIINNGVYIESPLYNISRQIHVAGLVFNYKELQYHIPYLLQRQNELITKEKTIKEDFK